VNKTFLLTGGNVGDRKKNLQQATALLEKYCGKIIKQSSVYETAAWGKTDQPNFLNQVLEMETGLKARQLMNEILKIEHLMGRKRNEKYGPRIIDIDLLFFNDEIIDERKLIIPHPELQNRRFALTPLAEIAPALQHPVFKQSIRELLAKCPDQLNVNKI
jgi:2-amino-4-hydroxy-6-hydroxymethyldihydropteridine diphosphokinase